MDNRIYFYVDNSLYTSCSATLFRQKVIDTDPSRLEALAIYYTTGACTQNATPPTPSWMSVYPLPATFDFDQRVVQSVIPATVNYANAQTLAHELGHCMDLFHTYEPSCCHETCNTTEQDYLSDVFGASPPANCWHDGGWSCDPFATGNTCTNNMMGGCALVCYYFSPMQIGKMHRALSVKSLNRYTLNAYQAQPLEVNTDQLWDFEMRLYRDVVVKSGHTLTITCKLEMPTEGKIIVEQGAKLVVDGGWITTADFSDTFWSGIQNWGTTNQHQYGAPYATHQGTVVLKNDALIEHAREGIQNMNPNDWSMIGGIVQVQGTETQVGATFKNCRRAVSYVKYQNFNPNNPAQMRPNLSYFNFCDFIVDDDYRGVDDFYAHVSMWYVDGINFRACDFRNEQTGVTESSKLGKGIISLDAKYTVTGKCNIILPCCNPCPEVNWTKGTFVGLDHGIHALNGVTDRAFTVDRCRFENNVLGVFASGMTNYSVTRNEFEFGNRNVTLDGPVDSYFDDNHRGIFSYESSGFRIEENTLTRDANATALCDGIVMSQSMEHSDVVYKNSAGGMEYAYIGEGQCIDLLYASSIGLEFLCNLNLGNEWDIWARMSALHGNTNQHSIRTQQGSVSKSAGNTFDQETGILDASDFRNSTDWPLNYWHNGSASQPLDVTIGWVGTAYTANANGCVSKLNNGGSHVLGPVKRAELEQELVDRKAAYVSTAYLYNSLVDGGNTDAVVQEVMDSWPQDAWELRNYLMSKSPYLSVEVLMEMMERNTLPLPMVLEVCVANPEATKKEGFIRWAQYEAPNPLPQYMIDVIMDSWEERTFRMELESTMGQHHTDMSQAGYMLLVDLKNNPEAEATESIAAHWAALPNFGARMAQAMTLAQRGEYADAIDHLSAAREDYPLKGVRAAEIDRAIGYFELLQTVVQAGRNETALTSVELDALASMADGTYDRPSTWIWNLLCYGYGRCRDVPSGGDQPTLRAYRPQADGSGAAVQLALGLVPNPADVATTFVYKLTDPFSSGSIVIRDAAGRELARHALRGSEGQHLWDTREVPPGAYSIDLLQDGARIATEQLLIKR